MDKRKVDSIYTEVLDLPPGRRAQRLDVLCEGDVELKDAVQGLLEAANQPIAGFETQFEGIRNGYWLAVTGEGGATDEDLSGTLVDIWRLEAQVGRGGLATVYRAYREDGEFTQRAAFKVMRRGLDTDDMIARFRAEREILATLEHPGIAGILDGGTLPDGRPYLVLEYVDGTSIVEYVGDHELRVSERLRLLSEVAAALQHAHQRLIVHRDVKPSNVMVTAEGAVRLLDFGIARIIDPAASPLASRLTRTGMSLLTPAYGTPEQVGGEPVTTASDVYQLGLLLAEVLTGNGPVRTRGEAPVPDVSGLADRDLRAIVQKATRLEPDQRYASARDFEIDIERHLGRRPVLARPDSWRYRAGKFLRRRPLVAPLAATALITVAVYVVTITAYSREVERERAIAEKTQAFMIRLFESPDPRAPADPERGRSITVVEALDIGRDRVFAELADQPYLRASLSRTLSSVYEALDQHRPAIELRELALELEESLYGEASSRALASMRALAVLNLNVGRIAEAERLNARQLEIARSTGDATELGLAEHAAGMLSMELGEQDGAAQFLESAIGRLLAQEGIGDKLDTAQVLALIESAAQGEAGLAQIRAAERLGLDALGPDSDAGLVTTVTTASALTGIGEYQEAESRLLRALPLMEARFGKNHPDTVSTRNNLGILYSAWGRYSEAEAIHADLLQHSLEVFGPASGHAVYSYQNLATSIARQGRHGEAIPLFRKALEAASEVYDEIHHMAVLPLLSMSYSQLQQDDPAAAEESATRAVSRLQHNMPQSHLAGIAQCLVAMARHRQGDEQALRVLPEARRLMRGQSVPEPYAVLCGLDRSAP